MRKNYFFIIGLICLLAFSMIINSDMRVYAQTDVEDFVDNNSSNVDSSVPPDIGSHSNFPYEQALDSNVDTLTEESVETPPIEDFVDNNSSDVDSLADLGTLSDFNNMTAYDGNMANFSETAIAGGIEKVGTDTSWTDSGVSASPLEFSHTLVSGSNRMVVVCAGIENGGDIDISGATYGGQTMVEAIWQQTGTTTIYEASIFYILEANLPSDGAQTVSITFSGTLTSGAQVYGFCSEFTGVSQGAPEATDETIWSSGTSISNDISPSTDAWVISAVGWGNLLSTTHGEGQVEVYDNSFSSSGFAVAELRGADGETSLSSTASGTVNRGVRIAASWQPAPPSPSLMDQEVQFTNVSYFLSTEELCIYAGDLGDEDLNVTVWTGSDWHLVASDLTANSWNNFTVNINSTTFTVKFGGSNTTNDLDTQDMWYIDACLIKSEGAGSNETAVDNEVSNIDGENDAGTITDFSNMTDYDTNMAVLTETQAIEFIGYAGGNNETGTDMTINKPTGTQDGDFMFAIVASTIASDTDGSTMASAPSGWTEENNYINPQNPQSGQHIYIYWKFAGASEPSSYSWTWTDACGWAGQIITLRGVDSISPIHVEGTTASGSNQNPNTPSITTTEDTCFVISLYCADDDDAITGSPPSGTTEIGLDERASPGNGLAIGSAYYTQTTAGSTGDKTWTGALGVENEEWIGEQYAFLPAADSSYTLNQEVQWIDIPLNLPNANLSIYAGSTGAEDILVDAWNGTGWVNLFGDLAADSWNNISITDYLISSTFIIRFRDGNPSGDSSTQDIWEIDAALIRVWNEDTVYNLDLEVQWTNADFDEYFEELCIKTGTF
uniref:hypothetical protein n=1 Tax=Candidatus Borrarchaeum sp. TaxID=2846742 RepID=UPI00257D5BC7